MVAPASPLAATLSSAAPSQPKRDGGGVSRMGAEQQLEPRRGGVARRRHRHSAEGDTSGRGGPRLKKNALLSKMCKIGTGVAWIQFLVNFNGIVIIS